MLLPHEEKLEKLWAVTGVKVNCAVHILRQKYNECLDLIKSNRNIGTYDAF